MSHMWIKPGPDSTYSSPPSGTKLHWTDDDLYTAAVSRAAGLFVEDTTAAKDINQTSLICQRFNFKPPTVTGTDIYYR